ncbi:hypothetical protein ACVMIH_004193 [Bradyrhizobium sp. USDA 4503]|uniref:Uncharacterized protein n=1 Tax=Bradyrhizobium brasilense TaxID=1419277 RepID=A0ABY8JJ14_9BRAD|nr:MULTISPECIES: hypothetical protein [Bradyrhizobium]WFU65575.1 hypothetical protein QA636_08665 [Bradyrhizobium brasilense]
MLPQIGRISPATSCRHEDQPVTMQSPDIAGFRFSTADFGERDRLPIFREQIGRMIVKLDPEPLSGAFHADQCARAAWARDGILGVQQPKDRTAARAARRQ